MSLVVPIFTGYHVCSANRAILSTSYNSTCDMGWERTGIWLCGFTVVEVSGTLVKRLNSPVKSFSDYILLLFLSDWFLAPSLCFQIEVECQPTSTFLLRFIPQIPLFSFSQLEPVLNIRAPLPPNSSIVCLQSSSSFLYTGTHTFDVRSSREYSRSRWKLGAVGRCAETSANATTFRELSKTYFSRSS